MKNSEIIRLGFLGTGATTSVANWHAKAFLQEKRAAITAVYNRTRESGVRWAGQFSLDVRVCETLQELLECCDAVIICTPNHTHFAYAMAALEAGKHILLEKPMALTAKQAAALARAGRAAQAGCQVGYVYRFAQPVQMLKKLVQEQLGPLYTLYGRLGGKRLADARVKMEWRMVSRAAGSGALHDFGSHLLDTAHFVTGKQVSSVFCTKETFLLQRMGEHGMQRVETDDAAYLVCTGGHMLSSFAVSRVGFGPMALTAVGEGGMAELQLKERPKLVFQPKEKRGPYRGKAHSFAFAAEEAQTQGWFHRQAQAFLNAVQGEATLAAGFAEGSYVDHVLSAALRSAGLGRMRAVDVPE